MQEESPLILEYDYEKLRHYNPGEQIVQITEFESLYHPLKFDAPATLMAHRPGKKVTSIGCSFLDPYFYHEDNFPQYASLQDEFVNFKIPHQGHDHWDTDVYAFMHLVFEMRNGGKLPQIVISNMVSYRFKLRNILYRELIDRKSVV